MNLSKIENIQDTLFIISLSSILQDSLNVLSTQFQQHPSILPIDFDVTEVGDLLLNLPPPLFEPDFVTTPTTEVDDQRVPVAKLSQSSSGEPNSPPVSL